MRNLLISVYITLTKDREDLITMASKFIIPKFPENTNVINYNGLVRKKSF